MKYEIAYISGSGNTEKLAHGIADSLPHRDTFVTDLSCEEITRMADCYLICFGYRHEAIPLKVMEVLEELEGKSLMFFVTASVRPNDESIAMIERKLEPFMPYDCDYRGLYLCPGQVSEETMTRVKSVYEEHPDDERAKEAMEHCQRTIGRPNDEDIADAVDFAFEKLQMSE